ncbi:trypsin-like serine peptidase [Bailinhaonella thermotolerans]|uniref:Serine protease n=1 Tax=Bailinhaonella thermotolerans TaxID=1070861 RepID=A0A3A4AYA8_9ACTN|nr:serine protease [Bailinhaonella thermotolerans]RJL26588.1 serine protease [Bailinhaonella thermotolerans]
MHPRARRWTLPLAGAIVAVGVVAAPAASGTTSNAPAVRRAEVVKSLPMAPTPADAQKIIQRWNPTKLKRATSYAAGAVPAARTASAPSAVKSSQNPATGAAQSSVPPASAPKPQRGMTAEPLTGKRVPAPASAGKVFFEIGNREFWCSAIALQAKHRNMVATAAHCAFDAVRREPVKSWVFIPAYSEGKSPYGIYVGHTLSLHGEFWGGADYDYDYAFVSVHDGVRWSGGKTRSAGRLGDNVDGQGIAWNRGSKVAVHAFGYPAGQHPNGSAPYDGKVIKSCSGASGSMRPAPAYKLDLGLGIPCSFTKGASGGPWLISYNPATKVGYLNGVNSLAWDGDADGRYDRISSPYFNADTYAVYRAANEIRSG